MKKLPINKIHPVLIKVVSILLLNAKTYFFVLMFFLLFRILIIILLDFQEIIV